MAVGPISHSDATLNSPYDFGTAVTPNDGTDLPSGVARAITCTVAGNVKLDLVNPTGVSTVIISLALGFPFIGMIKRVWAASTTATGIVALY